jgi:hypothetical protein
VPETIFLRWDSEATICKNAKIPPSVQLRPAAWIALSWWTLQPLYTFSLIKQLQDCPTRERMETEQLKLQSVEKIVEIFVCEAPGTGNREFPEGVARNFE